MIDIFDDLTNKDHLPARFGEGTLRWRSYGGTLRHKKAFGFAGGGSGAPLSAR